MTVADLIAEAQTLTPEEQLELLKGLVDLVGEPITQSQKPHSLRELRGLGKEIWQGIDAQRYIDQQRDEWDQRREN